MNDAAVSIWQGFRGHDTQIAMFRRAIERDRLGQAYLLVGMAGIGKRTFVYKLATSLFCQKTSDAELDACGTCPACRQMAAGTYPDYFEIGLPPGKNEIPLELVIGKREERGRAGLCHDIALTSMAGNRRVGVINDAGRLNEEGANAFLKTLEEPPEGALLFLIAEEPSDVLPTIRSRCQIVGFQPLSEQIVADLLAESDDSLSTEAAQSIAILSGGSLEMVRRLTTPELQELRSAARGVFDQRPFDAAGAGSRLAKLIEAFGDAPAQREASLWLARFLSSYLRHVSRSLVLDDRSDAQAAGFGERLLRATADESLAVDRLNELVARVSDITWQLKLYVQPRICIEALFFDLANTLRGEK